MPTLDTAVNGVQTLTTGGTGGTQTSSTLTTAGTLPNGLLLAFVGYNNVFTTVIAALPRANGSNMTLIGSALGVSAAGNWGIACYSFLAAASTAYSVAVDWTYDFGGLAQGAICLASWKDVDQSTPCINGVNGNGTSATPTRPITNPSGNVAIGLVYASTGGGTITATTGTDMCNSDRDVLIHGGSMDALYSASTDPTVQWSIGNPSDNDYVAAGFSLKAASAGTTKLRRNSSLSGLGSSGPFFHDPLALRHGFLERRMA